MNSLELWNKWEKTPKEIIQKTEDGLNSVSSIHRFKKATEVLGLYGRDWGLKEIKHSRWNLGNLAMAELEAIFYVKDLNIEFEISNSLPITQREADGKISFNSTYRKAIETDTIAKALSRLGLFADIYADEELISSEKDTDLVDIDFVEIGENDEL